jgi:hypothetical protein
VRERSPCSRDWAARSATATTALNILWHARKGAAKSDSFYDAEIGIHTRLIGLGV